MTDYAYLTIYLEYLGLLSLKRYILVGGTPLLVEDLARGSVVLCKRHCFVMVQDCKLLVGGAYSITEVALRVIYNNCIPHSIK